MRRRGCAARSPAPSCIVDVGKMIEGAPDTHAERASLGGQQAVGEGFDPRAVEPLPAVDQQVGRRMVAKIGRDEAQAQAPAARDRPGAQAAARLERLLRRPGAAPRATTAAAAAASPAAEMARLHRSRGRASRSRIRRNAAKPIVQTVPGATLDAAVDLHRAGVAMAGIELQHALERRLGVVELALPKAERADVDVDLDDVRCKPGRFAQALFGVGEGADRMQGDRALRPEAGRESRGGRPARACSFRRRRRSSSRPNWMLARLASASGWLGVAASTSR